eukprot:8260684-Pyramimonas_sp.AAC.1
MRRSCHCTWPISVRLRPLPPQDRSDIQLSVEELARNMAKPATGSWKSLIKLGKYFKTHDRSIAFYQPEDKPCEVTAQMDTCYAGLTRTRSQQVG